VKVLGDDENEAARTARDAEVRLKLQQQAEARQVAEAAAIVKLADIESPDDVFDLPITDQASVEVHSHVAVSTIISTARHPWPVTYWAIQECECDARRIVEATGSGLANGRLLGVVVVTELPWRKQEMR
jgi:hypothetical protein